MKLTAVVPLYNEEQVIDEFSSRLMGSLEKLGVDYQVIFLVEGKDGTLRRVADLAQANTRVRVDYCERRLGLGKALKKGLFLMDDDTDYVLTIDADLNHQPEEIEKLLRVAGKADVVSGCRSRNHGMVNELPVFKRVVSGTTNWILRVLFNLPSHDVTSGFRLYSRNTVQRIRDEIVGENFEITAELLIRAKRKGLLITEVPITFCRRPRGTSKLSFLRTGLGYLQLLLRLRF